MIWFLSCFCLWHSAGEYLEDFCRNQQQTVCRQCAQGYFLSQYSVFDRCDKCLVCQQSKTKTPFLGTRTQITLSRSCKIRMHAYAYRFVVLVLVFLQNIPRNVHQPQTQNVPVSTVTCAPTVCALTA